MVAVAVSVLLLVVLVTQVASVSTNVLVQSPATVIIPEVGEHCKYTVCGGAGLQLATEATGTPTATPASGDCEYIHCGRITP